MRGVRWRMHERGGDWHRYWVADCMPQDLDRQQALMRSEWRSEHAADGPYVCSCLCSTCTSRRLPVHWITFSSFFSVAFPALSVE